MNQKEIEQRMDWLGKQLETLKRRIADLEAQRTTNAVSTCSCAYGVNTKDVTGETL